MRWANAAFRDEIFFKCQRKIFNFKGHNLDFWFFQKSKIDRTHFSVQGNLIPTRKIMEIDFGFMLKPKKRPFVFFEIQFQKMFFLKRFSIIFFWKSISKKRISKCLFEKNRQFLKFNFKKDLHFWFKIKKNLFGWRSNFWSWVFHFDNKNLTVWIMLWSRITKIHVDF